MNLRLRLSGVLPVLAGAFLALSVFGCGGGDGGSAAPAAPEEPAAPAEPSPAATTRNEIIRAAAENIPVAGSVSQGAAQGQSGQGIVTPNRVTWNGSGGNNIRVQVGSIEAQPYEGGSNDDILEGVNSPDGVLSLVTDPDSGATSSAIVQVVSDMRYNTEATTGEFTPTFSAGSDNPNLVFGLWATANADNDITAIGSFADGTETPNAAIPTSGTYTGNLFAFYQNFDSDDDIEQAAYSVARVELTVADGTVSGRVFDIADKDNPDSDSFTFINPGAGGAIAVTMAPATPSSQDGGFFNETTTLSRDGQTVSQGVDRSQGRWGGQFFGDSGQQIAGTVGLNIEYSDDTSGTVFGSFSATRN